MNRGNMRIEEEEEEEEEEGEEEEEEEAVEVEIEAEAEDKKERSGRAGRQTLDGGAEIEVEAWHPPDHRWIPTKLLAKGTPKYAINPRTNPRTNHRCQRNRTQARTQAQTWILSRMRFHLKLLGSTLGVSRRILQFRVRK